MCTCRIPRAPPAPSLPSTGGAGEDTIGVWQIVKVKTGVRTVIRTRPGTGTGSCPTLSLATGSPAGLTGTKVPVTPPAFPDHTSSAAQSLDMNMWLYLILIPANIWPLFHTWPLPTLTDPGPSLPAHPQILPMSPVFPSQAPNTTMTRFLGLSPHSFEAGHL